MTARPLPSGTVTLLFTDIEGSTKLWEAHPDSMKVALVRHDALMRWAIEAAGGHVFKTIGDAFCAAFPTALQALGATLAAQRAIVQEPWPVTTPIKVRMALHTGPVESRDGDYFGPPLNRVARLVGTCHGGQTVLSFATYQEVAHVLPEEVSTRDLGAHRLKDLAVPEHIFQIVTRGLPADFPPIRSLSTHPNNLPQQVTNFIGREKEVRDLEVLLGKARLLTLTGSGGVGKTRLALQVAANSLESFPDGAWFVDLAPLSDSGLVTPTVAAALGLKEQLDRPIAETLLAHLRDRRLLVILDNCEHMLDVCASLADSVLRQCPGVRLLASSREALDIGGEQAYRVPSLSLPDHRVGATAASLSEYESVRLFVDRAVLAQSDFKVTDKTAPVVASICCRLDGIPLALELAAARVRSISVEEIAQRLDQRFRLLTGGSRTALPRQQTLRSLIDWSYDLLSEQEKALLQRLSVFSGGWALESAEAVCSD